MQKSFVSLLSKQDKFSETELSVVDEFMFEYSKVKKTGQSTADYQRQGLQQIAHLNTMGVQAAMGRSTIEHNDDGLMVINPVFFFKSEAGKAALPNDAHVIDVAFAHANINRKYGQEEAA